MKAILFSLAIILFGLAPATVQAARCTLPVSVQERKAIDNYLLEGNIAVLKATADFMEKTGRELTIVDMMRLSVEFAKTYPLNDLPAEHQACLREYYDAMAECLDEVSGIEDEDEAMEALSDKMIVISEAFAKKYPLAFRDVGPEATQRFLEKTHLEDKLQDFFYEHMDLMDAEHETQMMILTLRFMAEELEKLRK